MYDTIIVGGDFGSTPKESSIVRKISQHLKPKMCFNGGQLSDLPIYLHHELIVWMPNIDNENEKQYPIKSKGSVLICSKVMREGYTETDAVSRIFKMSGNAVIAIYKGEEHYRFRLIDALGNEWYNGVDIKELCDTILKFTKFTKSSIRMNTEERFPGFDFDFKDENLTRFIDINKNLSEHIQTNCGVRFFGNLSTRCTKLFPTIRVNLHSNGMVVSPRNIDKRNITVDDMVYVFKNENEDFMSYVGKRKPSVDTPTQYLIYQRCNEINYMIHGHAFIKDAPTTENYYLCGDIRESSEVIDMIMENNENFGSINLKNHGFLIYSDTLENLESVIEKCNFYYDRK